MKQRVRSPIIILNKYDDIAIKTAKEFFKRHNLPRLEERVRFGYAIGFGAIKPLKHILATVFRFNAQRFIAFYERTFVSTEVPHYEDVIAVAMLILSALAAIGAYLSPIIGIEYANRRKKAEKDANCISAEQYKELLNLFKYLILVYGLREAYYCKIISKSEFSKLKEVVKGQVFQLPSRHDEGLTHKLDEMWREFNRVTDLPFDSQLARELETIALNEIQRPPPEPQKIRRASQRSTITIEGLGVSPGKAQGPIKVIQSIDEGKKVENGDIGVFHHFSPEMVPIIKNCVASIGLSACGGRTGHLALVSRELQIPCVVRLRKDFHFEDSIVAFVNGDTGKITIITKYLLY